MKKAKNKLHRLSTPRHTSRCLKEPYVESEKLTTSYTYGKTLFTEGEREFVTLAELPTEQKELSVHLFPPNTEVARATVGRTYKVNLGNYESLDIFVSVSLPCYAEEINDTIEYAKQIVVNEARNQAIAVKEQIKSSKSKGQNGKG